MQAESEIRVKEGWRIEDFAPWYYLKDQWQVRGDYSIPIVRGKTPIKKNSKTMRIYRRLAGISLGT